MIAARAATTTRPARPRQQGIARARAHPPLLRCGLHSGTVRDADGETPSCKMLELGGGSGPPTCSITRAG
eukprot:4908083-Prymnesium_polylepis.1